MASERPVARAALAPHGIAVVEFGQPDDDPEPAPMPFDPGAFDLVLNRHASYHPREIARVLAPGGVFLTQQVGGDELGELHEQLGHRAASDVAYTGFRQQLLDVGLEVTDGAEHVGRYTFLNMAALVAYLQRVPWRHPRTSRSTATPTSCSPGTGTAPDRCRSRESGSGSEPPVLGRDRRRGVETDVVVMRDDDPPHHARSTAP